MNEGIGLIEPLKAIGWLMIAAGAAVLVGAGLYLATNDSVLPQDAVLLWLAVMLPISLQIVFGVSLLRRG